jgi:hypothetical protein
MPLGWWLLVKFKDAAQFGLAQMSPEAGPTSLEAAGSSETVNRHRVTSRIAHQLFGDLQRLLIVAGNWYSKPLAATCC